MAANAELFRKYVWLADVVYSSGRITREEIDRRWAQSSLNDRHDNAIPERTFHRWRNEIESLFNLIIDCERASGSPIYFIQNKEELSKNKTLLWLLNTFAVSNLVNESQDIQDRVLLEDMPSDARFLTPIIEAMRRLRVLHVTYQKFDDAEPHSFTMEPYCIKAFKQRWYMVGKSSDHPDEIRVYALDRIHEMKVTDEPFTMPTDFDGKAYFANYYGIFKGDATPQKVVIQVQAKGVNYLRSLPLHHSQKEIERTNEYSVLEYFIAPTFDFIQQLRTFGDELKVLQPKELANQFRELGWKYTLMYPASVDG